MSLRWSSYVAHNSPKGARKRKTAVFSSEIALRLKKVGYKVSLCELSPVAKYQRVTASFSPDDKALLKKVSCFSIRGPTRCSSSMTISGSILRKLLKFDLLSSIHAIASYTGHTLVFGATTVWPIAFSVVWFFILPPFSFSPLFVFFFVLQVLLSGAYSCSHQ